MTIRFYGKDGAEIDPRDIIQHEILQAFTQRGLTPDRLATLGTQGVHFDQAVEILLTLTALHEGGEMYWFGERGFDAGDWFKHFDIQLSKKQQWTIHNFPWAPESPCPFVAGKTIAQTHIAFVGIETIDNKPFTIREWYRLLGINPERPWVERDPEWLGGGHEFANVETCSLRWYLMPLVPPLAPENHLDYELIIPAAYTHEYEVAPAIAEVTKIALCKKQGIALPNEWIRCRDYNQHGQNVLVKSTKEGFSIGEAYFHKGVPGSHIALMRKL